MKVRSVVLVVVGAAASVLALSSCASIPTSGAVVQTSPTSGTSEDEFIRVLARPPGVGASPSEIVDGFLAASASFDDDYAVARTYLTSAWAAQWDPNSHVEIYQSVPGYRLVTSGAGVTMTALHSAGSINSRGEFSQPASTRAFVEGFLLRKVDGQWRIAAGPRSLVLSTGDIARAYRSLDLYFTDPSGTVLVPDPVFLPAEEPGLATTLVRQVLEGPTSWLAPAVTSGFPTGSQLAVNAVPVQNGIARVDLDPGVLATTDAAREAMAAQLSYALEQLEGVSGVRITVAGVPLPVNGIGAVSRVSDWPAFDPAARPRDPTTYAVVGRALSAVFGTRTRPVDGYFGHTDGLLTAATALDGTDIAGSYLDHGTDVVRIAAAGEPTTATAYRGREVTSLSWDRTDTVWIVDAGSSSGSGSGHAGVWAAKAGHTARKVLVRGLGGRTIRVLRVSRDGTRAAVIAGRGTGPGVLLIGRIERSSGTSGAVTLSGLRRLESSFSTAQDVGWADASTLLVSAREGGGQLQVYTVDVDGFAVAPAGSVPQLATVAACPGRAYLAGTLDEQVWSDRGNGWRTYVKASAPVYPG